MNQARPFYTYNSVIDTSLAESENHLHNNYEIYYLTQGECWYLIGRHSYKISAGDIILIPPNVIHGTRYLTPTHSRKLINCGDWYIPSSVRHPLNEIPCFTGSPETQKEIDQIFSYIEKESRSRDEFSDDMLRSHIAHLLLLILRKGRTTSRKTIESPIVRQAIQVIAAQYHTPISLADVARACFVSKEHLSRTFKQETGMGFSHYLTLYRLRKADALLQEHPQLRIIDIAMQCGFNESNYFSKVYKKMFGISPLSKKKENEHV